MHLSRYVTPELNPIRWAETSFVSNLFSLTYMRANSVRYFACIWDWFRKVVTFCLSVRLSVCLSVCQHDPAIFLVVIDKFDEDAWLPHGQQAILPCTHWYPQKPHVGNHLGAPTPKGKRLWGRRARHRVQDCDPAHPGLLCASVSSYTDR